MGFRAFCVRRFPAEAPEGMSSGIFPQPLQSAEKIRKFTGFDPRRARENSRLDRLMT
jgi:hypothetical protein